MTKDPSNTSVPRLCQPCSFDGRHGRDGRGTRPTRLRLVIGHWNFFGHWSLDIGHSAAPEAPRTRTPPPAAHYDFPAHFPGNACYLGTRHNTVKHGRPPRYRAITSGSKVATAARASDPKRARVLKHVVMTGHNQVRDLVRLAQ